MKRIIFLIYICLFTFNWGKAWSLIEVDITRGNLNPLPLAVSPLSVDQNSKEKFKDLLKLEDIGAEISKVVENNLRQSGLFNPLDPKAFLQKPDIAHVKPRFEDWALIKAQALITGEVKIVDKKRRVEFRLWDVLAGKEIMALAFTTVSENWRRVGHIITDKVYQRLTGEKGYFDTRIIYVAEEGLKTSRIKKLAIMDQDGFNTKYLTLGNELVLTPRFNPTNQMVTYLSYFKNLPRVYLLDIETGIQEVVGDFPGMTFAPRFSPDGKKIIMSFAKDGNSDIYTMDLESREVEKITNHPSIDTSPSYSPDGKYRDGRTLLEIMNEPEICEELEKEYWTYRMAKQTAMDMIAYGRAGLGNMDSVFMLEGEQQRDIMKLACDLFVKNEKRTQHFLQNANSSEPQKLSLSKTLELDM